MPRAGRNDPCPCGSGKKYKKCCMARDEQQEREQRVPALAASAPAPASTPERRPPSPASVVAPKLPLSPQDAAAEEAWKRFEPADYEGRIRIFLETLEAGVMDGELAFDMLESIWLQATGEVERERFRGLVARLQREAPGACEDGPHFFHSLMMEDAVPAGKVELIPELLEPFARDPGDAVDTFFNLIELLMYYDQTGPLLEAMARGWPSLEADSNVTAHGKTEFMDTAVKLILFRHLERGGSPRVDDPGLQAALSPFPPIEDVDLLSSDLEALAGIRPRTWTLDDFGGRGGTRKADPETIGDNLRTLSMEWLGEVRRAHGVPFARGEMARSALTGYQWEQVERSKPAPWVLVPQQQPLDRYVAGFFQLLSDRPYKAASLMELLPLYLAFLVERGLLSAQEAANSRKSLQKLARDLAKLLVQRRDPNPAAAIEVVWREVP